MNRKLAGIIVAAVTLAAIGVMWAQGPSPESLKGKTAEQSYKNILVLKGTPADQLLPSMQFISASLGVECEFCHVQNAFEKDDKKPKATARKMIEMQFAINKNNFEGQREVTCFSCHRGANSPIAVPIISDEVPHPAEQPKPADAAAAPASPPSADPILEKFLQVVGGVEANAKITSRVEKGNITIGPRQIPLEVFAKAPDKRITVVHAPNGDNMTAFDGQSGWLGNAGRAPREMNPAEGESARLDARAFFPNQLKQTFSQFRARKPEKIGDRPADLVVGMREGQPPVRLYFDQQSGLLVRMVRYVETPLGRVPAQVDYADYRDVDGVKTPFRWTLARPGGRFTIQLSEVQQNVPVDDAKFAKPPAPPASDAKQPPATH